MKPIRQTLFPGDMHGSKHGNCVQAAVASLLELPLDSVPDFLGPAHNNGSYDKHWRIALARFLAKHNLGVFSWYPEPENPPHCWHLISGGSPRAPLRDDGEPKWGHTIVGYAGQAIFDPHPTGDCKLLDIWEWDVLFVLNPHERCPLWSTILGTKQDYQLLAV